MTHPAVDDLGADRPRPEVVVHLDRCAECREVRAAWRGDDVEPNRMLWVDGAGDADRYTLRGLLGQGGMGEVFLAYDEVLEREVAVKILRQDRASDALVERFEREVRLTAQLQHPAIVPVHRVGRLADGRPFYVMKRVEGRTLRQVLPEGLPARRVVRFVARVGEAVAYAHHRGVVHGDLKPENVLIGPFDELALLDFGLAGRLGDAQRAHAGTRGYMAPELARGEPMAPAADVWALGALLFEVLVGRTPADDEEAPAIPRALASVWSRCRAPANRRPAAAEFSDVLRAWLDGERRTAEARARLAGADDARARAAALRSAAQTLHRLADEQLADTAPHDPIEAKRPGWALLTQAREADAAADEAELDVLKAVQSALDLDPELPEARRELAEYHQAMLLAAERRGDDREARRSRRVLEADPNTAAWLAQPARIEIRTTPTGRVVAAPGAVEDRQWTEGPPVELGATPIAAELRPGRWRIEVHAEGSAPAVFPVHLVRGEQLSIDVALAEPVDGAAWVPAGWCTVGGDGAAVDGLSRRRVWVGGFHLQRRPVTVLEYVRFLNALPPDLAERHQPLEQPGVDRQPRPVLQRSEGDFVPEVAPSDDPPWQPDWPIVLVDQLAAVAYARWWSDRTGRRWRLPHDLEWEKAALGDDGRVFPWGTDLDPAFARMQRSHAGTPSMGPAGDPPTDRSPYGVLGLGGNVRDWCCNQYHRDGDTADGARLAVLEAGPDAPFVLVRGGSWISTEGLCRAAARFAAPPTSRSTSVGFRLATPS